VARAKTKNVQSSHGLIAEEAMEKLDERTFKFALRVVRLVSALPHKAEGEVLGRQLLRSGTSVGANVEEAYAAATQRDFTFKLAKELSWLFPI
jgi:predicted metallo-beta-lactamase superfamily hydrolase